MYEKENKGQIHKYYIRKLSFFFFFLSGFGITKDKIGSTLSIYKLLWKLVLGQMHVSEIIRTRQGDPKWRVRMIKRVSEGRVILIPNVSTKPFFNSQCKHTY